MGVMKHLSGEGRYGELDQFLNEYAYKSETEPLPVFCENAVANSLLGYYSLKAKEHHIDFRCSSAISKRLSVSDGDVCVVLGNALENALEACGKLAVPDARFISVEARTTGGQLLVKIENSYGGLLNQRDGRYLSTKSDQDHGPAGLTLTEGYLLPSTDEFTVTGTGPLWVQKYPGNTTGPESAYDHIDWSFFAGKLVVTPGIPAGSYPLKMTAINDKPQYGSLDFTLTVSPASAAHGITIETDGHGIAGSNEPSAVANTEIALTAIPYRGYLFKEWQVVGGGAAISGNRFAMDYSCSH